MTERLGRKTGLFLVLVLAASSLVAENIKNWAAPATWSPTKSHGGVSAQDLTNPLPFTALAPCRIVDTRGNGAPITGGTFTGGSDVRNYDITGICGVPASAHAVSLNFTVTPPGQTTAGFLVAWPTGGAVPPVSILNWDRPPQQIANAAVVPLSTANSFTVNVSAPTNMIVDVNGYYYDGNIGGTSYLPAGEQFVIAGDFSNGSIIYGENKSTGNGSRAIRGIASGATGVTSGVLGQTLSTTAGAGGVTGQGLGGPPNANFASFYTGEVGIQGLNTGTAGYGIAGVTNYITAKLINENVSGTELTVVYLAETSDAARFFGNVSISALGGQAGNLAVAGTLSKGAGAFKIDHPVEPESKYLYHSFVESPDMMNIYNGNVVLDHSGEATVNLPAYFEALNMDFRYQLTSIGKFSPVFVEEEIQSNQFRIAGGRPYGKVSWQVTGIRHDKFANANRIPGEVEKEEEAKGFYLHPEAFGKGPEMNLGPKVHRATLAKEGIKEVNEADIQ
jgi:hypothetical protein